MKFLSEENIIKHKENVKHCKLMLSILGKSVEGVMGKTITEIYNSRLKKDVKQEALGLLYEITLHEIFFDSFSERQNISSKAVCAQFGSEGALMNLVYKNAININQGFLLIGVENGKIKVCKDGEIFRHLIENSGILALDLCEHAYYGDYGFSKEKYLISAIPYLNFQKLENAVEKRKIL